MTRRRIVAVLGILASMGCATSRRMSAREQALANAPLEYGEQCADARRRALGPETPAGLVLPRTLQFVIPPVPAPLRVRGRTALVTVAVDSVGKFKPADLLVSGLNDPEYTSRIRKSLIAGLEFYPAHIGKCAVAGTAWLTFQF
jgi:hypothetical protein